MFSIVKYIYIYTASLLSQIFIQELITCANAENLIQKCIYHSICISSDIFMLLTGISIIASRTILQVIDLSTEEIKRKGLPIKDVCKEGGVWSMWTPADRGG